MTDSFPRRKAVTRGFRLGAPRNFAIAPDGERVLFLRSDGPTDPVNQLWLARFHAGVWREERLVDAAALLTGQSEDLPPAERAKRERLREVSGGITGYTVSEDWRVLAFTLSGQLWVLDLTDGRCRPVGAAGNRANPTMSPDGSMLAATAGGAVVLITLADDVERILIDEGSETVSWGSAEFVAAEEMHRFSGMWWSPDSSRLLVTRVDESAVPVWTIADPAKPELPAVQHRYPAAGSTNAEVRLFILSPTGDRVEVDWDRDTYEYLARARWDDAGLLLSVQNRSQTTLVTMVADPVTGSTRVRHIDEQERWVELVGGLPRLSPAGDVLTAVVDPGSDTRRLIVANADGTVAAATPPGLQVRSVARSDDDGVVLVGSEGDPSGSDLFHMGWDGNVSRLSTPGAWSAGTSRAGTTVVASASLAAGGSSVTVTRGGDEWQVPSNAELPGLRISPDLLADPEGWHHIAVLWPTDDFPEPLPVIMSPYGGPHAQRCVRAASAYATEQWLADQGFCVIVADGPGAPSRPSNEYTIFRDLAEPPLAGQIDALDQVLDRWPERIDSDRVGIRGWSFGGYLAALAVLARPDRFHAAVAGAPVTDWSLYDTHYTERYLGTPQHDAAAYAASSLLTRAAAARVPRPLLLIHGLADDNVVAAHTLRLSSQLLAAGYRHAVLPLSGVTHMTPQEIVTENLLWWELEFFRQSLQQTGQASPTTPVSGSTSPPTAR